MKRSSTRSDRGRDGAPLAPKTQAALDAIKVYWCRHGIPPARMDLARALGLQTSSAVDGYIHRLIQAGRIEIVPGAGSRAIRLVHDGEVPLITGLGKIPSNEPLRTDARRVDRIAAVLADRFTPRPDMFVLLARKELAAIGLKQGDLIAVRETSSAPDGAVAVGKLEAEVMVGKYRQVSRKYVELTRLARDGTNRTRRINLTLHDFTVEGVVVGAIRSEEIPLASLEARGIQTKM